MNQLTLFEFISDISLDNNYQYIITFLDDPLNRRVVNYHLQELLSDGFILLQTNHLTRPLSFGPGAFGGFIAEQRSEYNCILPL